MSNNVVSITDFRSKIKPAEVQADDPLLVLQEAIELVKTGKIIGITGLMFGANDQIYTLTAGSFDIFRTIGALGVHTRKLESSIYEEEVKE